MKIEALLIGNSIIVVDIEKAREIYKMGFYGKFIDRDKVKLNEVDNVNSLLQLSILEALYLYDKGMLVIKDVNGKEVTRDELINLGRNKIRNFDIIYQIYKELRDRGFVVKSGLKFGSLFAIYEKGPGIDHAPVLIHFIEPNRDITALDITRAARLSHSVNKRFVIATYDQTLNTLNYVAFEWFTP